MKVSITPFLARFDGDAEGIARQLRRVLYALLGIQAVLALALIVGAVSASHAASVLVQDRLYPIGELQRVTDNYAKALATAHKVESGNISALSAMGVIDTARAEIITNWRSFRSHNIDARHRAAIDEIERARGNADQVIDKLQALLKDGSTDRLSFFVSGPLNDAIDPLTIASDSLTNQLRDESVAEEGTLQWRFAYAYVVVALLAVAAALIGFWGMRFVAVRVIGPLAAIAVTTESITDDRHDAAIPGLDRSDEIGAIARALAFARQRSIDARRLSEQTRVAQDALHRREVREHAAKAKRAADLDALFQVFEHQAGAVVQRLKSAGPHLRATASAMSGAAADTEHHALATAALTEQSATSTRTIASSSAAMAKAIEHVSDAAQQSQLRVGAVHRRTTEGREHAESLGSLVNEIESVLDLITGLAGQTNLLALNATIEAARAGEAGRGFAVVAEEVKGLARQTQHAAGKIESRLAGVRTAADTVLATIQSVDGLVEGLDEATATVASAVEEQRDMTRRIAGAIAEVEDGTANAAANMQQLHERAERTRGTASDLASLADDVASSVEALRGQVNKLIEDVRAA